MSDTEAQLSADYALRTHLTHWLLVNGFAEEKRGYGHVSAEDLADALINRFEIRARHSDGKVAGDE